MTVEIPKIEVNNLFQVKGLNAVITGGKKPRRNFHYEPMSGNKLEQAQALRR